MRLCMVFRDTMEEVGKIGAKKSLLQEYSKCHLQSKRKFYLFEKNPVDSDCFITYRCFFLDALLVLKMSQSNERLVLFVLQLSQTCPEVVLKVEVAYSRISRKFPLGQKLFFEKCLLISPELSQNCPRHVLELSQSCP